MTSKQNGHKHGPCERCGIELRRSDAMRRVLAEGQLLVRKVLFTARDEMQVKIWLGRARRAAKGQSVYSEAGR